MSAIAMLVVFRMWEGSERVIGGLPPSIYPGLDIPPAFTSYLTLPSKP